jgi:flagellar motor switch protein FliM/N
MSHRYRPLKASELSALETRLAPAVAAWSAAWLARGETRLDAVVPLQRTDHDATHWLAVNIAEGAPVLLRVPAPAARALAQALLPAGTVTQAEAAQALIEDLGNAALGALARSVFGLTAADAGMHACEAPGPEWFAVGAGNAQALVRIDDAEIGLLLGRASIGRLLPPRARSTRAQLPLETRSRAIRSARLRIELHLEEGGLTVGDLRRLRQRDVVVFDHPITKPVPVRTEGGPEIGSCYLGSRQGYRAARLVKQEEA